MNNIPRLGPAIYRALDGKSDYACIVTQISVDGHGQHRLSIHVYLPNVIAAQLYTQIKFDGQAGPQTAKPGTVYFW